MERVIPLLKRNDPLVTCVTIMNRDFSDSAIDAFVTAVQGNTFVNRIFWRGVSLSGQSWVKIFTLLLSNPNINNLEVNECQIGDIEAHELANVLKQLPKRREPLTIALTKNDIGSDGAKFLAEAIAADVPMETLYIKENPRIGTQGLMYITEALQYNTTLKRLDAFKCQCGDEAITALEDSLTVNRTLKTIVIGDRLSTSAVSSLASILQDPECPLTSLYLWSCALESQEAEIICAGVSMNNSLEHLALSYNRFHDSSSRAIASMILSNKTLTTLELGANKFSQNACGFIGMALTENTTLKYLNLSRNKISDDGVWILSVALKNHKSLTGIDLRSNEIGFSGAQMLSTVIESNHILENMRLSGNPFGDTAIATIAVALKTNTTLKILELDNTNMHANGLNALCEALIDNHTLVQLSVSGNMFGADEALSKFVELLEKNTSLGSIAMSDCAISDKGCELIERGLIANSTLHTLDISYNDIHKASIQKLVAVLRSNYTLLKLEVDYNPFFDEMDPTLIYEVLQDYRERNTYWKMNQLIIDMSQLATDPVFQG